jgi:paraquat-inducible protein A
MIRTGSGVQTGEATGAFIACPECDLLQREVRLPPRGVALCQRCKSELYHHTPHALDRTLAFAMCGLILYLLANFFPLLDLVLNGSDNSSTLYGAVLALYHEDLLPLAALVFFTTILVPGLEIVCYLYLLLPLRFGRRAPGFKLVFRLVQTLRPWGMIEVLMLGVLVAVVKLAAVATVTPGIALWSAAALMVMFSALAQSFNPRDVWALAEPERPGQA